MGKISCLEQAVAKDYNILTRSDGSAMALEVFIVPGQWHQCGLHKCLLSKSVVHFGLVVLLEARSLQQISKGIHFRRSVECVVA